MISSAEREKQEALKQCNQGKHFFVQGSEFCDRCDIDFNDWYKAVLFEAKRDTSNYLIAILQTIINEQVQAHNLDRQTGVYIIEAVKDQVRRKGW